jgi:hypothetical protein
VAELSHESSLHPATAWQLVVEHSLERRGQHLRVFGRHEDAADGTKASVHNDRLRVRHSTLNMLSPADHEQQRLSPLGG